MNCPECGKTMNLVYNSSEAYAGLWCPGCEKAIDVPGMLEIIDKLQAEIDIRDQGIAPPDNIRVPVKRSGVSDTAGLVHNADDRLWADRASVYSTESLKAMRDACQKGE